MISSAKGLPLTLYLTANDKFISALLARKLDKTKCPVLLELVASRCWNELLSTLSAIISWLYC